MELVSVIIVNFNKKDYLINCLESLKKQTSPNLETIVVDDASSDGSQDFIKRHYPEVDLILNIEEDFLCISENIAINRAKGKYVFFLETDVLLEKNYIEELINAMRLDKKIGMAGGKILRMDKKTIDTTGLFLGKSRKPIERGFNQRDNNQFNKAGYIFGIGQIAGLFRRSALEDVKLGKEYFDENYNIFYEDLDLAWRINLRGWKAYYNPCAVAYHVRGETAKTQNAPLAFFKKYYFSHLSADLQFHLIKNRYMTVIKNDLPKNFILNLPHIFLYDLKLWTYILLLRPMLILRIPKILGYFKVALRKRKILKKRPIEQNTP